MKHTEHHSRRSFAVVALSLVLTAAGCSREKKTEQPLTSTTEAAKPAVEKTVRIAVGTQDTTINCAAGGTLVRELKLLEKYLPKTGKYASTKFEVEWKNFTSGPPLTSEMLAGKLDMGVLGDFPSVLNGVAFQKAGKRSVYVSTLSGNVRGAGNGLVVPKDSPATKLADLKGKQISVPFGSAAHGMLLRAVNSLGWDPEKDVSLVSQSPEVGGTALKANKIDGHADFVPFAELFPFRGTSRKIYDGSSVNAPTSHGFIVSEEFTKEYPELVVAYLQATLEADKLLTAQPEKYSELIEKVSGVEAEVVYMFHGPLGIQTRDFTPKPEFRQGLKTAVETLKLLKKHDSELDIDKWIDERFIREAAKLSGRDFDERLKHYDPLPVTGNDARTNEALGDTKQIAQIWVKGEEKVRNYATPRSAFTALSELKAQNKAVRAVFVHDRNTGIKLLADQAYYVQKPDGSVAAFLLKEDATAWSKKEAGQLASYDSVQKGKT